MKGHAARLLTLLRALVVERAGEEVFRRLIMT
jgi:hypothetical protein